MAILQGKRKDESREPIKQIEQDNEEDRASLPKAKMTKQATNISDLGYKEEKLAQSSSKMDQMEQVLLSLDFTMGSDSTPMDQEENKKLLTRKIRKFKLKDQARSLPKNPSKVPSDAPAIANGQEIQAPHLAGK